MDSSVTPPKDVLVTATRCADCPEPVCMKACPEQADLRALFEFVARQAKVPLTWRMNEREAEEFAIEAIEKSFTPWLH
jgi:NADPH-dependent glutamate synthase beta subunit-like oxidoreductase